MRKLDTLTRPLVKACTVSLPPTPCLPFEAVWVIVSRVAQEQRGFDRLAVGVNNP